MIVSSSPSFSIVLTINITTIISIIMSSLSIPQWGAADAEIKVSSAENTEFKGSPYKAWSRSYIAMHATLTAMDFFLANVYPSGPFTCIFSEPSPDFFVPV